MQILQTRLAGVFWIVWGILSLFVALMTPLIMSDNMNSPDLLPYAGGLWAIAGLVHIGGGSNLTTKPIEGSESGVASRQKSLQLILIALAAQIVTAPFIPWA